MNMENNRPVFENFGDFVKFVYGDAIYEAVKLTDLSDLQTTLGSNGMDAAGKKALSEIESLASQAGINFTADDLSQIGVVLGKLSIPDVTQIDSVDVDVQQFEYDNLRGGAVKTQKGDRVGLAQFLTKANKENLKPQSVGKIPDVNKEKKRFELDEDGDFVKGSGLLGQYLPVTIEGTLDLKKWKFSDPVKNSQISTPSFADPVTKETWKNKNLKDSTATNPQTNLHAIYALYYPSKIENTGQAYESKEVETFVRPKATVTEKLKPIVVQEDLPLFKVNTAELTEEGKNSIMQALSNVTTAKSISIRGGASQEGTPERNKELCKLRAAAVAEFLKPTFPGTTITADEEGDIQPKSPETDEKTRKTFRKITMNVDGTSLVKQTGKEDETVTFINTVKKRAQKVTIKVAYITVNSSMVS
jgi:outer membrane protein OmpA-like peptidoglycan-associated protein